MCGCLSRARFGDLAHNPGMCPDWESNQQPFDLQAGTQFTEPHQPGCPHSSNLTPSRPLTNKLNHSPLPMNLYIFIPGYFPFHMKWITRYNARSFAPWEDFPSLQSFIATST